MSESIFETFTDERGNISVRVSRDVQVLTSEEADRIEAEYKRTQAENAELRKERDFYCNQVIENGGRAQRAIDALNDENAKLRELVHELWDGYADPPCDDCPLKDNPACVDCPICAREAEVIDRMRELGVEVDG